MNGQTTKQRAYDNKIGRDGSHADNFVRNLSHTIFACVKAAVGSITFGSASLGLQ